MNTANKIYIKLDAYYKMSWRKQSAKLNHLKSKLYKLELENSLFENYSSSYGREFLKGKKEGDICQSDLDTIRQLINHSGIDLAIDRCLAYPHKVPQRKTKLTYGQRVQIASLVNREIKRRLHTESIALKTEFNILESHIASSQMQIKSITNKMKELDKIIDSKSTEINNREFTVKLSRFLRENIQKLYQDWNKIRLEANKVDSLRNLYSSGYDAVSINDLRIKEAELKVVREESLNLNKEYSRALKIKRVTRKRLYASRMRLSKRIRVNEFVSKTLNDLQPKLTAAYQIQYIAENCALQKYKQLAEKKKVKKLGGLDEDDFLKKKILLRKLEHKIRSLKRRIRVRSKLLY